MSFPRAKSAARLYEAVAAYDLVVTPDAPLSSALNRELDRAQLGPFATPPRRHAAGRRETAEDRLAFLELVEHDDVSWKRCAYAIGNVLQCWEHQGSHDAILEYDAYVDDATEAAVDRIGELNTASMGLTRGSIDPALDVAVIAPEMLTGLERSYLPLTYDTVELFTTEPFDLPPFRILNSPTAIVDAVVDAIDAEHAEHVGIVLDGGSEYSPLVESALEAADVPFFGGPGFVDLAEHRAFLQLLRTAHCGTDVRIGEIRPLLATLDIDLDVAHDAKRLYATDAPELAWLVDFCEGVESSTFDEALSAFEDRAGRELEAFREELATLGLLDDPVTESAVDQLAFYLRTYEVPLERENEGVLLADATAASYVGRDVVFFLGLDEGWTDAPPRRPWVDREAQFTRNLLGFQLLLQSGSEQHYLVQDAAGGSPVTPCLYFEELLDEEFDRFSDLPSTTHSRTAGGEATSGGNGSADDIAASTDTAPATDEGATSTAFERTDVGVEPEPVETISQSSLNTYVNSPRDYYFSRLVDSPDRDYFTEGNLFHDFAELYVTHPEFVDDAVLDEVVEFMLAETRPLVRSVDENTRRTTYRIGLETIVEYLDANPPSDGAFLTSTSGFGDNVVADHFGKAVDSPVTERWFEDEEIGVKGLIDLVHSRTRLVDFKSGAKKSTRQVVKRSALDDPSDTPEFQALLYLTYWRSEIPDEELSFTFFHFLDAVDDAIAGDADLEDTLTTVSYYPTTLADHVNTRAFFESLATEGPNDCTKTLSKLDYSVYASLFDDEALPRTSDSDELIASAFGQEAIDRFQSHAGEYKYVKNGAEQVMRQIADVYGRNYFETDLDAFESFVDERLVELNRRRAGEERFPVDGLAGEPNYRRVENRDLLLEGDR